MTLTRLKRIELIVVLIATVLFTLYGSGVGWLLGDFYGGEYASWKFSELTTKEKSVEMSLQNRDLPSRWDEWKTLVRRTTLLTYILLAFSWPLTILFFIRRMAQKKRAAAAASVATFPSISALFGAPFSFFLLLVFISLLGEASQEDQGWPFQVHVWFNLSFGIFLSLIVFFLLRVYLRFRNEVASKTGSL